MFQPLGTAIRRPCAPKLRQARTPPSLCLDSCGLFEVPPRSVCLSVSCILRAHGAELARVLAACLCCALGLVCPRCSNGCEDAAQRVCQSICIVRVSVSPSLDIHFYSRDGGLEVVDVTTIHCLVGRIKDRNEWATIERGGTKPDTVYVGADA